MNFAESLAYWYLRFNGFFPIVDLVLHRLDNESPYTADCDLLALRCPHVYEEIGGQERDWDAERFQQWGITLSEDTIGLMVEVKSGSCEATDLEKKSFAPDRWLRAIQRFGLWPKEEAEEISRVSREWPLYRADHSTVVVAKLLIASVIPATAQERWLSLPLQEAECFVVRRMRRYERKLLDRMFFPDTLAQYLAWKHGGRAPVDGGGIRRGRSN